MGVKGLRSFLRKRIKVSRRVLSVGSTLVIDGDGWMFHFLQQCKGKLNMDTGGSYKEFASVVLAEVNRLKSYGLQLVVLFDGPKNPLKDRTTIERLREREWASLHQSYSTETIAHNPEDFPIAPLCKEQLMATLDLCSVRYLHCNNEADQEIALLVQQQNLLCTPDTRCFAYGQDTDYIVMEDCPYIEFGAIDVDEAGKACAEVWSRIEVCQGLTISEEQFLDFVHFLGNDYTAPLVAKTDVYAHMQQTFGGNTQLIMESWLLKMSTQRKVMLRAVDFFRPLPANSLVPVEEDRKRQIAELQFAIDYSRAFYNLEPLGSFHEQARLDTSLTVPYSSASCVFDFHHYSDVSEGKFFVDLGRYVKAAGKMGTEGVDRGVAVHALTYLKRKCTSAAITSVTGPVVTDEHRAAIQMMLKQLQQRPTQMDNAAAFRSRWEDLLAAYVYQKTCALMVKSFPKGSFSGEHNAPLQLFDSVLFHTILRDLRTSAGQNVPIIPIRETSRVEPVVTTVNNIPPTIATPCSDPVSVPAQELELPETPHQNAEQTSRLRILERKELLQKSLDDRLSTEERTALRQQGLSGFMPKKVLVELGLEYLVNKSLTKAEKKALREQSLTGSWKLVVPSNPEPLPIFSVGYQSIFGDGGSLSLVADSLTENGIEGLVPEINATPCLPAPQAAPFAHIQPSSSFSNNTGLHDQAHQGLSPHATPTLTKAEQNAVRKAEKKAKRKAERRELRQDMLVQILHAEARTVV